MSLYSPTVATLAAYLLASQWPDHYNFDPGSTSRVLAQRVAIVRNAWRIRQGMEPDIAPDRGSIRSNHPDVEQSVAGLVSGSDDATRQAQLDEILRMGIGALPWIHDALAGLPDYHVARPVLVELADALCRRVGRVEVTSPDHIVTRELRIRFEDLQGAELTSTRLVGLIREARLALPDGRGTIGLSVDRVADGEGICVALTLGRCKHEADGTAHTCFLTTVDGRNTYNSVGVSGRSTADESPVAREMAEEAMAALVRVPFEAAYNVSFEIGVHLDLR